MNRRKKKIAHLIITVALVNLTAMGKLQDEVALPIIIVRAARNQDQSLKVRDRCRYEQSLRIERFKPSKGDKREGQIAERLSLRETVVMVEPSRTPDEQGRHEIITRVIADTDDDGKPKKKVDPDARTALASQAFLDLIFFPLLPEKIRYYRFEEIRSDREGERAFRFLPKQGVVTEPVVFGLVLLDASTGEVLTVKIEGFRNLEALDKHLSGVKSFYAIIDYSQFNGKYRMPTYATGAGLSEVSRFKGEFKFSFRESRYVPVLALPE